MARWARWIGVTVAAAAMLCGPQSARAAGRPDPHTVEIRLTVKRLTELRLFQSLRLYCQGLLERSDLRLEARAEVALQLANVLLERGGTPDLPGRREAMWNDAREHLKTFLAAHPDYKQADQHRFLLAMVLLSESLVQQSRAKVLLDPEPALARARDTLQQAISMLEVLIQRYEKRLTDREPGDEADLPPGTPTWADLSTRKHNCHFRLAQSLLHLARAYPSKSPRRTRAARRALAQYKIFTPQYVVADAVLEGFLGKAECHRLMGKTHEALKVLDEVDRPDTPAVFRAQIPLLRARTHLDAGRPDEARLQLAGAPGIRDARPPEAGVFYVEVLLALRDRFGKRGHGDAALAVQREALLVCARLADAGDAYHDRWARLLVARRADVDRFPPDTAHARYLGEALRMIGKSDEAAKAYAIALKAPDALRNDPGAAEVLYEAAQTALRAKAYARAAEWLDAFAARFAADPRAAKAALLSAYALGQIYRTARTPERARQYQARLEGFLARYGEHELAPEARWMLARWHHGRGEPNAALPHYRAIPDAHPRGPSARESEFSCLREQVLALWAAGKRATAALKRYRTAAESFIARWDAQLKEKPDAAVRLKRDRAAVRLALLLVDPRAGADVAAVGWVETVRREGLSAPLADALRIVRIRAAIHRDRRSFAEQILDGWLGKEGLASAEGLLDLIESLRRESAIVKGRVRTDLSRVMVRACQGVGKRREQLGLKPDDQLRVRLLLAEAYLAINKPSRAKRVLDALFRERPNSARVVRAVAQAHVDMGHFQQALPAWRHLLRGAEAGSRLWFEAKYHIALSHYRLGDTKQARAIVGLTKLQHPELGGPSLRKKFEKLASRLGEPD